MSSDSSASAAAAEAGRSSSPVSDDEYDVVSRSEASSPQSSDRRPRSRVASPAPATSDPSSPAPARSRRAVGPKPEEAEVEAEEQAGSVAAAFAEAAEANGEAKKEEEEEVLELATPGAATLPSPTPAAPAATSSPASRAAPASALKPKAGKPAKGAAAPASPTPSSPPASAPDASEVAPPPRPASASAPLLCQGAFRKLAAKALAARNALAAAASSTPSSSPSGSPPSPSPSSPGASAGSGAGAELPLNAWTCIDESGPVFVKLLQRGEGPEAKVLHRISGNLTASYFPADVDDFDAPAAAAAAAESSSASSSSASSSSQGKGQEKEEAKGTGTGKADAKGEGKGERVGGTVFIDCPVEEVDFMLGHAQVPRALEVAVTTLRVGAVVLIRTGPSYGYSTTRRPKGVPEDAPLELLFGLTRVEKEKNLAEMSLEEKFAFVESRRVLAKALVAGGKPASASRQYDRAIHVLEDQEVEQKAGARKRAEMSILLTNQATCAVKAQQYASAVFSAGKAIDTLGDTRNAKARFQRGLAHRQLGNWEEARRDLIVVREVLQGQLDRSAALANAAVNASSSSSSAASSASAQHPHASAGQVSDEVARATLARVANELALVDARIAEDMRKQARQMGGFFASRSDSGSTPGSSSTSAAASSSSASSSSPSSPADVRSSGVASSASVSGVSASAAPPAGESRAAAMRRILGEDGLYPDKPIKAPEAATSFFGNAPADSWAASWEGFKNMAGFTYTLAAAGISRWWSSCCAQKKKYR